MTAAAWAAVIAPIGVVATVGIGSLNYRATRHGPIRTPQFHLATVGSGRRGIALISSEHGAAPT